MNKLNPAAVNAVAVAGHGQVPAAPGGQNTTGLRRARSVGAKPTASFFSALSTQGDATTAQHAAGRHAIGVPMLCSVWAGRHATC